MTTSTPQRMFAAWQKTHKFIKQLDGFNEWLKACEFNKEAELIASAMSDLNVAAEQLKTKLFDTKKKRG